MTAVQTPPQRVGAQPRRSHWHRRASAVPLLYLAGLVIAGLLHPVLPVAHWLLIHLLLLGAATNAIVQWSAHFAAVVLRAPEPAHRRAETARLIGLNVGVLAVLAGTTASLRWLGVAGAAVVFGAVCAHLGTLAARLRRALPARFSVTVHYYLAAGVALLVGIPLGAVQLVSDVGSDRLVLVHAHVNLLGWILFTVLGTLVTLWPTTLRTRMSDRAVHAASTALLPAMVGLSVLAAGLLTWWRPVAVSGLAVLAGAIGWALWPALESARRRPPGTFATWSIAAGLGWLMVALVRDGVLLATSPDPGAAHAGLALVLLPLLVGFVGQVLLGAMAYLVPMVLGGGPAKVREHTARLDRHWAQRVVMLNLALVVFLSPVSGQVRITTSVLLLVALVQFLWPAALVLLRGRR
ncbi:MAG TPA: hypothetical protein VF163_19290 [Micromonosporaceae bacterium]